MRLTSLLTRLNEIAESTAPRATKLVRSSKMLRMVKRRLTTLVNRIQFRGGIGLRHNYASYKAYVEHQKKKTADPARIAKWKGLEWDIKLEGFREIFERNAAYIKDAKTALCLGSRTGQEVKALREPYTIEGDVHDLQFGDQSFDLVFTNIFDHVLEPERFCAEMERVTRPGGVIIIHLQLGFETDEYAETVVTDPMEVLKLFHRVSTVESRGAQNTFDGMNWELILRKT
jgi:SAM-dependent methyltransferase